MGHNGSSKISGSNYQNSNDDCTPTKSLKLIPTFTHTNTDISQKYRWEETPAVTQFEIYIIIAVPKSLMEMNGEIRRDAIAQRVDEMLNGSSLSIQTPARVIKDKIPIPTNESDIGCL